MKRHLNLFAASRKFAACTVVLSAFMLPTARAADEMADPFAAELSAPPAFEVQTASEDVEPVLELPAITEPSQNVTASLYAAPQAPARPPVIFRQSSLVRQNVPIPMDAGVPAQPGPQQQMGYVRLNAPLSPSPRPNIPIWSGSTMITNQAFAPHEMLYPHTYRAIYPPFYHKVKGGWIVTPFGVRSHERWELQGTQVQVKYRSQQPGWFH
jgi:hypothetical protein